MRGAQNSVSRSFFSNLDQPASEYTNGRVTDECHDEGIRLQARTAELRARTDELKPLRPFSQDEHTALKDQIRQHKLDLADFRRRCQDQPFDVAGDGQAGAMTDECVEERKLLLLRSAQLLERATTLRAPASFSLDDHLALNNQIHQHQLDLEDFRQRCLDAGFLPGV